MRQRFTLAMVLVFFTLCSFGQKKEMMHNNPQIANRVKTHSDTQFLHGLKHEKHEDRLNDFLNTNIKARKPSDFKSPQGLKQRLDSLVEVNGNNDPENKLDFTYDYNGNLIQYIEYYWESNTLTWLATYKYNYTYNSGGNMTQELDYGWDNTTNAWGFNHKYDYTYDSGGNKTQELDYGWDISTNAWVSEFRRDYTYNLSGEMTQEIDYQWDFNTNAWAAVEKYEITYNSGGNMTQVLVYNWDSSTSAWVAVWELNYTYDSGGNMTQQIEYAWDSTTNTWVTFWKLSYTYDSGGKITQQIEFEWDGTTNAWVASYKNDYSYDSNGNPTLEIYSNWDVTTSQYIPSTKFDYTYDLSQNLSDLIIPPVIYFLPDYSNQIINKPLDYSVYDWDGASNSWIKIYNGIYNYTEINTTSVTETIDLGIKIYPNPVSDYINVTGITGNATFELYSLQGVLLVSKTLIANEHVDFSGLSNGVYFYTLTMDRKKQTGKLTKK
jgi:hypothetical protein